MKKSAELRQELNGLVSSQDAIMKKAEAENRALSTEETASFEDLQEQITEKRAAIQREEQREENLRFVGVNGDSHMKPEERELKKITERLNIGKALREAGSGKLTGVESEINAIALEEMRGMDKDVAQNTFNLPSTMVRASAQTVSEDSGAYGGALVVDSTPKVVDAFVAKTYSEKLGATMLTGLQGPVPLPVISDFNFTWADETETIGSNKAGVAGPKLTPKRLGAVVLLSNRLLNQSSIDVQSKIISMLSNGAARAFDNAAINGLSASKQPVGLLNMSGLGAGSSSAAVLPTWALVNELKGKIMQENSTENSLGYLCDPTLMSLLETIQKASGVGFIAENGKIGGYNSVASSLLPAIAAAGGVPELHHLIFGDWSQMFMAQFGGISFVVDGVSKADANSVKVTVNMEGDVQVANKKAFAVNSYFKLS
jgi:HK97 family phage major capsid protein